MNLTLGTFDQRTINLPEMESVQFKCIEGQNLLILDIKHYRDVYEVNWEDILRDLKDEHRITSYRLDFREHIRDVYIWSTGTFKLTYL